MLILSLFVITLLALVLVGAITPVRQRVLVQPITRLLRKALPPLSTTERIALEAGTVGFEGQLLAGHPDWAAFRAAAPAALTEEEQAFLDGPVAELCEQLQDWEISHERADLSPAIWAQIKRDRFFGLVIPKAYGGLGFSAAAHSAILQKIASVSGVAASTVAVPNSLGPGELIVHYGTPSQKDYYLPRLARGEEIPCFALTGPQAGSDATSLPDTGVVEEGLWEGERVLGVRLNFDKRYITLAPVASLVGVAFQLQDPDNRLGKGVAPGLTLALVPRITPGLTIGRRHFPLNVPFQNGPIQGKDVFVPLSFLIGGPERAGEGWKMLVECLSIGRAVSLPSMSAGSSAMVLASTSAYARLREQFGRPIGQFEGIQLPLGRMAGRVYALNALARASAGNVDAGERPGTTSAMAKYHATELARQVVADGMDIQGGKGIVLGPSNMLGRVWQGAPIAITVEGANILTRNLMIFGQGLVRAHPFVLRYLQALELSDARARTRAVDAVLWPHVGQALVAALRAALGAWTPRWQADLNRPLSDPRTMLTRWSAALALASNLFLLALGGQLKMREATSARLGDIWSWLYIGASAWREHEVRGRPRAQEALVGWVIETAQYEIEHAFAGLIANAPSRWVATLLRLMVLPFGTRTRPPSDALVFACADTVLQAQPARTALLPFLHAPATSAHPVAKLEQWLAHVRQWEPAAQRVRQGLRTGELTGTLAEAFAQAEAKGLVDALTHDTWKSAQAMARQLIAVDDFAPDALAAGASPDTKQPQASPDHPTARAA